MSFFDSVSPEDVARIEAILDHTERCSMIFLLYDNLDTCCQYLFQEQNLPSRYLPSIDSALLRENSLSHTGSIATWARSCVTTESHWREKFVEALLIIQNFQGIKLLRLNRNDCELRFQPYRINTSSYVDMVRKALYFLIDHLSNKEWSDLRIRVIKEANGQLINTLQQPTHGRESREFFVATLMSTGILKIKNKEDKMDFSILSRVLKGMDLNADWVHQFAQIEDAVNRDFNSQTLDQEILEEPKRIITRAPLEFNLDAENPGTILILNIENYERQANPDLTNRKGSKVDCEKLEATFGLLNFKVVIESNLTSLTITSVLPQLIFEFCEKARSDKKQRCFVLAILAHGNEAGFYDIKGNLVKWDQIIKLLRHSNTEGLPRLLLVQSCQGTAQITNRNEVLEVVRDGPFDDTRSANLRDLFDLRACVSGYAAYRHEELGSYFIHSFCKHILLFGRDCDLDNIAKLMLQDFDRLSGIMRNKGRPVLMTSQLNVTASKSLYLRVPRNKDEAAKQIVRSWKDIRRGFNPNNFESKLQPQVKETRERKEFKTPNFQNTNVPKKRETNSETRNSCLAEELLEEMKQLVLRERPQETG